MSWTVYTISLHCDFPDFITVFTHPFSNVLHMFIIATVHISLSCASALLPSSGSAVCSGVLGSGGGRWSGLPWIEVSHWCLGIWAWDDGDSRCWHLALSCWVGAQCLGSPLPSLDLREMRWLQVSMVGSTSGGWRVAERNKGARE